jgi:hypothetical protein
VKRVWILIVLLVTLQLAATEPPVPVPPAAESTTTASVPKTTWRGKCSAFLLRFHQEAETEKYGRLFGYPLRAALKDHRPTPRPPGLEGIPERRWLGFLVLHIPPEKASRWFSWLTPNFQLPVQAATRAIYGAAYDISLFGPFSYYLLRPALHATTRWVFGKPKEMTIGLNIVLGGMLAAFIYDKAIDSPFRGKVADKIVADIPRHADRWVPMVEGDYRFRDIARGRESETLTERDAHELAFIRNRYYAMYYGYMRDSYSTAQRAEAREWLLLFPAFHAIKKLMEEGIGKHPYYFELEGFQSEISPEQVDALVDLTVWKLGMDEAISVWVRDGMPAPAGLEGAEGRTLGSFLEEPFAQALLELHQRGVLSDDQLRFRLQEEIHWQGKFRWWEICRVGRWKLVGAQVTDQVLNIVDTRKQTMREIGRQNLAN